MLRHLLHLCTSPLVVALALLGGAAWMRARSRVRGARIVATVAVIGLWAASTPVVADLLVRGIERRYAPVAVDSAPMADAIVVLGGAIGPALPPRLDVDLSSAADRVRLGAALFRAGKAPFVVVTGASDPDLGAAPESADMKALLVEWGVPADAVLEDPEARSTRENAVGTARLLGAKGLSRVLLVTSAVHMARAADAFRAVGFDVTPCPTDFLAVGSRSLRVVDFLPDAEALAATTRAVHEHIGSIWYGVCGWTYRGSHN